MDLYHSSLMICSKPIIMFFIKLKNVKHQHVMHYLLIVLGSVNGVLWTYVVIESRHISITLKKSEETRRLIKRGTKTCPDTVVSTGYQLYLTRFGTSLTTIPHFPSCFSCLLVYLYRKLIEREMTDEALVLSSDHFAE